MFSSPLRGLTCYDEASGQMNLDKLSEALQAHNDEGVNESFDIVPHCPAAKLYENGL